MQALILAGGEGTRLRPLTSDTPKAVVTLVDQPFMGYMLEWLRCHDVDNVVISCGYLATQLRQTLGDGSQYGLELQYIEEPHALGTGGALKYAEDLLEERFFVVNGDQLTDIDLSALRDHHERNGAGGTIALIGVKDPSAYGLVRQNDDTSVREFVEKPGPDTVIDTNLVNAGVYILQKEILGTMAPAGTNISIEREVFPTLVNDGLYGFEVSGYWMDLGTPQRYLQGTADVLNGHVQTAVGQRIQEAGMRLIGENSEVKGRVSGPSLVGSGVKIGTGAIIGGLAVIGDNVTIGERVRVADSVILEGAVIGDNTEIVDSIVCHGAQIGAGCNLSEHTVVGAGVKIGDGNILKSGVRVFPGVNIPAGGIKF